MQRFGAVLSLLFLLVGLYELVDWTRGGSEPKDGLQHVRVCIQGEVPCVWVPKQEYDSYENSPRSLSDIVEKYR